MIHPCEIPDFSMAVVERGVPHLPWPWVSYSRPSAAFLLQMNEIPEDLLLLNTKLPQARCVLAG